MNSGDNLLFFIVNVLMCGLGIFVPETAHFLCSFFYEKRVFFAPLHSALGVMSENFIYLFVFFMLAMWYFDTLCIY